MTEDRDLDRAIDDVARELTEGAPSGALRARVMQRLPVRGSGFPVLGSFRFWVRGSRFGVLGSGFAAVAAIVIAVVLLRDRPDSSRRPGPFGPGATETARATGQASGPTAAPLDTDVSPAPPVAGTRKPSPPAREEGASAVAALAPPPIDVGALDMEPIDPMRSIQLQELAVPSISLERLPAVDPLSEGESR